MDFSLSDDQKLLREEIIRFARRELSNGVRERDQLQTFSRQLWLKCGEMRLQGLPVPQEYGGIGLDPLSIAIALEAFGYGCHDSGLVFSVCAHLLSCVVPIWRHGTEEQKQRYLPGLCNGTLIAANAMSEPGSGSDAFSMSTKAVRNGNGYLLNGAKIFVTNGPVADLAVVFAITDSSKGSYGGITAFLLEKGTQGFRIGQKFDKMGLNTSLMGELVFEDVYVSADAILGGIGAGATIFAQAMDWERIFIAASHVGAMDRLLEDSIEYARTRTQFGQPIGKFQAISHRVADMKVKLETARLLTYYAAWHLERVKSISLYASMTKLYVSECLVRGALDAVQMFGGYGYLKEYEVERFLRDSIGSTIYSGTSEIQKNIIARWLSL